MKITLETLFSSKWLFIFCYSLSLFISLLKNNLKEEKTIDPILKEIGGVSA